MKTLMSWSGHAHTEFTVEERAAGKDLDVRRPLWQYVVIAFSLAMLVGGAVFLHT